MMTRFQLHVIMPRARWLLGVSPIIWSVVSPFFVKPIGQALGVEWHGECTIFWCGVLLAPSHAWHWCGPYFIMYVSLAI